MHCTYVTGMYSELSKISSEA